MPVGCCPDGRAHAWNVVNCVVVAMTFRECQHCGQLELVAFHDDAGGRVDIVPPQVVEQGQKREVWHGRR